MCNLLGNGHRLLHILAADAMFSQRCDQNPYISISDRAIMSSCHFLSSWVK